MELRFVIEHVQASVKTAEKLRNSGDRERSITMLEDLGKYLTERIREGILTPPNIDVKPAEPG